MDKRIGAQLYTIRDYCETEEAFEKAMAKVREIGYKHVQISGVKVEDPQFIKDACDKNGLEITCTHRSYAAFMENFEDEVKRHQIFGCKYAGIGGLPKEAKETKEIFLQTIDNLNNIYDKLQEYGITFTYHNHAWEFMKFDDGKYYMDYMIEKGRFSLLVDVYWLAHAGIDPIKFIRKNAGRIHCVHFKDRKVYEGNDANYSEIGCGNLDWDEIIKACEDAGVQYALVEQDVCRTDSMECLETSYKYLTTKGFN